ncbi:hypothetical protein EDC51_102181 [Bibersteinia trehalosi]|nr:hypothetical protein EDC51_102181 [Bibersteinia trehalosi]
MVMPKLKQRVILMEMWKFNEIAPNLTMVAFFSIQQQPYAYFLEHSDLVKEG